MRLSTNTWHYKLVTNVFGEEHTDYISLCKYFWSIVFCIFSYPVILVVRPLVKWHDKYSLKRLQKKREKEDAKRRRILENWNELKDKKSRFHLSRKQARIITWCAFILMTGNPIVFLIINGRYDILEYIGFGALIIGTVGGIVYFAVWITEEYHFDWKRRKDLTYKHEPKKPNVLIEYLKSKKQKVCPMIDWELEDNNDT